jgi:D-alanyl-D-alanine carboxypeptidase
MKKKTDSAWLAAALDYVPKWLGFQLERYEHVGCTAAIAREGELLGEFAFGQADLASGTAMTPRHRLRIASHSKTFTASGVMLLREQGKLGLDDPIGRHVSGLHKDLAGARIAELLSHGAGITRDGDDSGQFLDRRPFLCREELREALARKQPLAPGLQLKYSNHGYGLLGLLIEEVTGSDYAAWMQRNVIGAAGLKETVPDMAHLPKAARMAKGHSTKFPYGERLVVPGDNVCDGIAPAAGYVATAADVVRFFSQLAPDSPRSILSPASRREMMHRRWRDEHSTLESHYGLGTMIGAPGPREWFGHTGSLQGFISRTARFPATGLTITVLCNALDGPAYPWVDGIASIVAAFKQHGAPSKKVASWGGRWWTMWGASDFVPMGDVVCQVQPAFSPPFDTATTEFAVTGRDKGMVAKTSGYNSPGQPVRLVRGANGKATEFWVGGTQFLPKQAMVAEVLKRYRPPRAAKRA